MQLLLLPPHSAEAAQAAAQRTVRSLTSAQPGQHALGAAGLNLLLPLAGYPDKVGSMRNDAVHSCHMNELGAGRHARLGLAACLFEAMLLSFLLHCRASAHLSAFNVRASAVPTSLQQGTAASSGRAWYSRVSSVDPAARLLCSVRLPFCVPCREPCMQTQHRQRWGSCCSRCLALRQIC